MDKVLYPWADKIPAGKTPGSDPGYEPGKYLSLFEERVFRAQGGQKLTYYLYDPTLHGFDNEKKYPVIFALHGAGNALSGKLAVNYCGFEYYASPQYQKQLGGAYIVVPLANEVRGEDGSSQGTWMTVSEPGDLKDYSASQIRHINALSKSLGGFVRLFGAESVYTESLVQLLKTVQDDHPRAGKTLLAGSSAGGFQSWRLLTAAPELFSAAILMAPAYMPPEKLVMELHRRGMPILFCHGQADELVPFSVTVEPMLSLYQKLPNMTLYTPELVYNKGGTVASNIAGGVQMGQHCINNAVQCDLLFADGTPMCDGLPGGVMKWIADALGKND